MVSLASYNDDDNAHTRYRNLSNATVQLKIEEDTTRDIGMTHLVTENVSYMVFEGQGLLMMPTTLLGQGSQPFPLTINEAGRVGDLEVVVNIDHTRTSDLEIVLESPGGTIVELFSGVGDDGDNFNGTVLDDQAIQSITSGAGPFTGHFQPEGNLADFRGQDITGAWTLHIADMASNAHIGALIDWSLLINLATEPAGNLNFDSSVDVKDIDLAYASLGSNNPTYDLDGDGDVDVDDANKRVSNIIGTRPGNTDLDFDVDITDFTTLVNNFDPTDLNAFHGWEMGNFDGDIADLIDLILNLPHSSARVTQLPPIGVPASTKIR